MLPLLFRDVAAARAAQAAADAARGVVAGAAAPASTFTVGAARVEYVSEKPEISGLAAAAPDAMDTEGGGGGVDGVGGGEQPALADLARVFARFASAEEVTGAAVAAPPPPTAPSGRKGGGGDDDDAPGPASSDDDEGEADDAYGADAAAGADAGATKHSRRARKAAAAARVASLKRTCPRPEVVEAWDTTAPDPELLVALKATRNAVPVPRHWSQKRPYLAGKRGLERPPFELPAFIAATGVGEMRAAYVEKEGAASLKAAARARVRPKAGRLDLDYQVLHDAFFVHQTKPPLAGYGDVYYEGKEFEAPPPAVTPGALSAELREALGMPPDDPRSPPPWLVSMQRWGPPPSYPRLPIPGLSAPLPPGAAYGYQPGGWGKPPVDEGGRPLFGDAFGDGAWAGGDGTPSDAAPARWGGDPPPDKAARWGELAPDEEEEEEEEEGEGEEGEGEEAAMEAEVDEAALAAGTATAAFAAGVASTAPLAGAGLATPAPSSLDLRTGGGEPVGAPPPALDTGLDKRATPLGPPGAGIMASDHTYVLPGAGGGAGGAAGAPPAPPPGAAAAGKKGRGGGGGGAGGAGWEAVALDPAALDGLDEAGVAALAAARVAAGGGGGGGAGGRADFSDLVAAQAVAAKRKAAARADAKAKGKDADKDVF